MRLLRRKQWVDFSLNQLMSYEFWKLNVHLLYEWRQIDEFGKPKGLGAFMPPEMRPYWSDFPDDMPILPYPRENIIVTYCYLLIQIAIKYDEKLGQLVKQSVEEALAGGKKYMEDFFRNEHSHAKLEYLNDPDSEEDIPPTQTHPSKWGDQRSICQNFYNSLWRNTSSLQPSIDDICETAIQGFKRNMKEILDSENMGLNYDKKYWNKQLDNFSEKLKGELDSLAETWMIDLCRYKFIL